MERGPIKHISKRGLLYIRDRVENEMSMDELLSGDLNRLRYIQRYSTSLVLHRENVAEHSYYVALYALFIMHWVEKNSGVRVDQLAILYRCLFHDVDECRSGDMQRDFKYASAELRRNMEAVSELFVEQTVSAVFPEDGAFNRSLSGGWKQAKDDSIEGRIVAFADFLSVVSYLLIQSKVMNVTTITHYETTVDYVKSFDAPEYDFIRPLVFDVKRIVEGMINA